MKEKGGKEYCELIHNKVIHKVEQTWHWKLVFAQYTSRNCEVGIKILESVQMEREIQICI